MQGAGKLTDRQRRVLAYFEEAVRESGTPPTVRQVMRKCGLKSPRGAQLQLRALADSGLLTHEPKKKPAYRPLRKAASYTVPIMGRAPAGHPMDSPEDHRGDVQIPWRVAAGSFAVRVIGESMRDAHIIDGDIAVVDPSLRVDDGQIVLALMDNAVTIKRLRRRGNDWWLEPANVAFKKQVPKFEEDRVIGRVVAVVRQLAYRVK